VAGIAGAIVSHPADLILTKTSAAQRNSQASPATSDAPSTDWRDVVKDLIRPENGGISNLFVGLPARATFFFLVIGLQFFLYDYVKSIFQVGSDDLSLVLDVFYAVRAGLVSD
jgi:Mitochondrial carrier protein